MIEKYESNSWDSSVYRIYHANLTPVQLPTNVAISGIANPELLLKGNLLSTSYTATVNENPDTSYYAPVDDLSSAFGRNFTNGTYWYVSLFYRDDSRRCTNFFFWEKVGSELLVQNGKIVVIYNSGDAYDYYSYSEYPNNIHYGAGSDTVPYRFVYDLSTKIATLYNSDSSVRWQSPVCEGIETNCLDRTQYQISVCGDATDNLAPALANWVAGYVDMNDGSIHEQTATLEKSSKFIPVESNAAYTFSYELGDFPAGTDGAWRAVGFYDANQEFIQRVGGAGAESLGFTTTGTTKFIRLSFRAYGDSQHNTMLNSGSSALPYVPSGYQISIILGNATYSLLMSDPLMAISNYADTITESVLTSHIRRLVFDGTESGWRLTDDGRVALNLSRAPISGIPCVSTHYLGTDKTQTSALADGECTVSTVGLNSLKEFSLYDARFTTIESFKSYLKSQAAAKTPLCLYYVLSSEITSPITLPDIPEAPTGIDFDIDCAVKPSSTYLSDFWSSREKTKKYQNSSWIEE